MAWKKRLPANILMDAQVWMPRGEGAVLSGSCPGSRHFPSVLLSPGEGDNLQPSLHAGGISSSLGALPYPAQLALGTGNEQGNYHLQPRKKLHPKTLVSCLVL